MPIKKGIHANIISADLPLLRSRLREKRLSSPSEKHDAIHNNKYGRDVYYTGMVLNDSVSMSEEESHFDILSCDQVEDNSRSSCNVSTTRKNMQTMEEPTPSAYPGIKQWQVNEMLRISDIIIQDVLVTDKDLEDYVHKSALTRLLMFSKQNNITEVQDKLWLALCKWLIRNLSALWCFRSRKQNDPMSGYLVKALSQRLGVCLFINSLTIHQQF